MNLATLLQSGPIITAKPKADTDVLLDFVKANGPSTTAQMGKALGIGNPSASTQARQLWKQKKLLRLEGSPIKYSYVEQTPPTLRCQYCGNVLTGGQRKYCSQICNTKTQQMRKKQ